MAYLFSSKLYLLFVVFALLFLLSFIDFSLPLGLDCIYIDFVFIRAVFHLSLLIERSNDTSLFIFTCCKFFFLQFFWTVQMLPLSEAISLKDLILNNCAWFGKQETGTYAGGRWIGKTNFVEIRSLWHVFRSFDRMWSFYILCLQVIVPHLVFALQPSLTSFYIHSI